MSLFQWNTHISNDFGVPVRVVVTHPNGRTDDIMVEYGSIRNVSTEQGPVTVAVYDPTNEDQTAPPSEQRTSVADVSYVVKQRSDGKPKLLRTAYGKPWEIDPKDELRKYISSSD